MIKSSLSKYKTKKIRRFFGPKILKEYLGKRKFSKTPEPAGKLGKQRGKLINKLLKKYRRKRNFNKTKEPYG